MLDLAEDIVRQTLLLQPIMHALSVCYEWAAYSGFSHDDEAPA